MGITFLEFRLQDLLPALASSVDGKCSCTELYDINTNIYGIMSDSRRSPTTTPHSGGKGPASRTRAARGSRHRDRTPNAVSVAGAKARRAPRGADKGSEGTDKQSGAETGAGEALRTPYTAAGTAVR